MMRFKLFCGDILEIEWDGNVHVAPSCGAQFAKASDAMLVEIDAYMQACGEPIEFDEQLHQWGEWLNDD